LKNYEIVIEIKRIIYIINMFNCSDCGKSFKNKSGLTYHLKKAKNKCNKENINIDIEKKSLLKKIGILENGIIQLGEDVVESRIKVQYYEDINKLYMDTIKKLENELIEERQTLKLVIVTQENKAHIENMMNKVEEYVKLDEKPDIIANKIAKIMVETLSKTMVHTLTTKNNASNVI